MKQIFLLSLTIVLLAGCKKAIKQTQEEIAETLIVKAITDGRWTVTTYYVDGTDYKSGFDSYEFQFKTNRTVDAVKNSSTESTGNWNEDRVNFAIIADYPPTASLVLQTLDGTWKIVDSTWTWVKATQTINGKLVTLELTKK
ncbi:MAG: hypothetical protein K2Q24_09515 [Chitinophagaceae bacterium]|jgi:hypothetical protein|nr:hypothetical protein [Chitinophagaceae bacterium]